MLTILLNSGSTPEKREIIRKDIAEAFREAGADIELVALGPDDDFVAIAEKHVKEAKAQEARIVAAGGDGTVNLVACLCYKHKVTLGILPYGTFNYFAREHGIPLALKDAVEVVLQGREEAVSVGLVNDKPFINNASFGLYTKLIKEREQASFKFGRIRLVAALSAFYSLLHRQKLFHVTIEAEGKRQEHRTPLVFVGNNTLQLENLGLEGADFTRENKLALIVMKKTTRWEVARFFLRGLAKSLSKDTNLQEVGAAGFDVSMKQKKIELVVDGEISSYDVPLAFRVAEEGLKILVPQEVKQ